MSIDQELSKKILVFRFTEPSSVTIVVDKIGSFQSEQFAISTLPFSNCTFIHFEPTANILQIRFGAGPIETMNEVQISKMEEFIQTIPTTLDLHFSCYDPAKSNLYAGIMSISEAQAKGYVSILEDCSYSVAKFDTDNKVWIHVKAIITDDGRLILDPDSYCDRCVLFLSEEEWNEFPQCDFSDPSTLWRWDFEENAWVDIRTVDDALEMYKNNVYSTLQRIEMTVYLKSGQEYFNVVHNPLMMKILNQTTEEIGADVAGEWKDKLTNVFSSISGNMAADKLAFSTDAELMPYMSDMLKEELITLKALIKKSTDFVLFVKYWQRLPEISTKATMLTKDDVNVFTVLFNNWIETTFGTDQPV